MPAPLVPPPSMERIQHLRKLHGYDPTPAVPQECRASPITTLEQALAELERACREARGATSCGPAVAGMSKEDLAQHMAFLQQRLTEVARAALYEPELEGGNKQDNDAANAPDTAVDVVTHADEESSSEYDVEVDSSEGEPDDGNKSHSSDAAASAIEGLMSEASEALELELDEPDEMFEEDDEDMMTKASKLCCSVSVKAPRPKNKPNRTVAAQLSNPMCDPLTIVYCLFRYRKNRPLATALAEKIASSEHLEAPTYALHTCYLMLIEPLSVIIEAVLLKKCKTSLHWALQVHTGRVWCGAPS